VSHLKGKTSFVTVSRVPGGQKGVVQRSHEDEFQCKMAKVVALIAIAAKVPNDRGVSAVSRNLAVEGFEAFQELSANNRLGTSALSSQSFAMTGGLVSAFPA